MLRRIVRSALAVILYLVLQLFFDDVAHLRFGDHLQLVQSIAQGGSSRIKPSHLSFTSSSPPSPALIKKYARKQTHQAIETHHEDLVQHHQQPSNSRKRKSSPLRFTRQAHSHVPVVSAGFRKGKEEGAERVQNERAQGVDLGHSGRQPEFSSCCFQSDRTKRPEGKQRTTAQTQDESPPLRPEPAPEDQRRLKPMPGSETLAADCF